jgi:cytoskeletal protein CcmA (bactofilin family)
MRWAAAALGCLVGASANAATPMSGENVRIRQGEVVQGDRYVAGGSVDVLGRLEGDLLAAGAMISVPGEVTGDVLAGGSVVTLGGHIGEAARVTGSQMIVTGTVDGDLVFCGGNLQIAPSARIGGDLWVFSGAVDVQGEVAGSLLARTGRLTLSGRVGRNADVETDEFVVDPQASIGGDLRYLARRPPKSDLDSLVTGRVERVEPKKQDKGSVLSAWSIGIWLIKLLGALLVGLLALRVWPARSAGSAAAVAREPGMALGIGLGTGLVLPIAAVILVVISLLVATPLAVIVWVLVAVGFYLGKLPVGLWIGDRLLRRGASDRPRPLALLLGVGLLYLVFLVPYLGTFVWFVASFVGLGAIVLAAYRAREVTQAPA